MMKRILLLLLVALFIVPAAQAQTVKWCIRPEYSHISYMCADLFKCVDGMGKMQLIDSNGKALLPNVDMDAVTDFEEGYAVVLKGNRILGFIAEGKTLDFEPISGEYYATTYNFFSEGLLAVADSKGKIGYMNVQGEVVIPCKYVEARPFRQGFASVEIAKKKVYYINQQGKTANPDSFHGGKLTKGSSFNEEGEAVVANYQNYAVINTKMQVKRKIKYTSDLPVRACDYAYSENGGDCRKANRFEAEQDQRIETYSENGVYGYRWKDNGTTLPAQFGEASPWTKGRAIVSKDGKYGVLEQVEGEFVPSWPKDFVAYSGGSSARLQFSIRVPASLNRSQVMLDFDDGSGNYQTDVPLEYSFKPVVSKGSNTCTLRARVSCDGLLLWEASKDLRANRVVIDIKSPAVTSVYADEDDNQTVSTVLTNTSSVSVAVTATLSVAGQSVPFKGTLAPKQSKTLSITLKVTEDANVQATVIVKADGHDCGSKTSTIALKKI